jgi:purine-binding chemotaxis protein CheW
MSVAVDTEPFILFEVAGTTYAVRSDAVQQVLMVEHVTPLPNASAVIEGVVYARGQVIPALNLRSRFGFEKMPFDVRSRLVVVNVNGRTVGLLVDSAREFVRVPPSSIETPPEGITKLSTQYIEGIATLKGRLVVVLKLAEVVEIGEADPV